MMSDAIYLFVYRGDYGVKEKLGLPSKSLQLSHQIAYNCLQDEESAFSGL
jgi:hypothetical protein